MPDVVRQVDCDIHVAALKTYLRNRGCVRIGGGTTTERGAAEKLLKEAAYVDEGTARLLSISGRLGPPRVNVWLKRLDRPGDNLTRPGHPGPTQDVPRPPRSQSTPRKTETLRLLCGPFFALS